MDDQFTRDIISMRGDVGRMWLESIPALIKKYEEQWEFTTLAPFRLTCNYVAPVVRRDGTSAVIKMRFPKDIEFPGEFRSLQVFSGQGAVRLLEMDEANAVMLLERVEHAMTLKEVRDDTQMITILSSVIKILDKPYIDTMRFQTIADWGSWFSKFRASHDGTTGSFPNALFEKAEEIFKDYIPDNANQYLLHGDLHRNNILLAERGWLTIDPRGVIGEREFEPAVLLRTSGNDASDRSARKELIVRRASQFSEELGFEKQRMLRWAFAQSMLMAIWISEDYKRVSKQTLEN